MKDEFTPPRPTPREQELEIKCQDLIRENENLKDELTIALDELAYYREALLNSERNDNVD